MWPRWITKKRNHMTGVTNRLRREISSGGNLCSEALPNFPLLVQEIHRSVSWAYVDFYSHGGTPIAGWFRGKLLSRNGWWLGVALLKPPYSHSLLAACRPPQRTRKTFLSMIPYSCCFHPNHFRWLSTSKHIPVLQLATSPYFSWSISLNSPYVTCLGLPFLVGDATIFQPFKIPCDFDFGKVKSIS